MNLLRLRTSVLLALVTALLTVTGQAQQPTVVQNDALPGAVVGGTIGAVIGNNLTHGRNGPLGAVLGALAGGFIGSQHVTVSGYPVAPGQSYLPATNASRIYGQPITTLVAVYAPSYTDSNGVTYFTRSQRIVTITPSYSAVAQNGQIVYVQDPLPQPQYQYVYTDRSGLAFYIAVQPVPQPPLPGVEYETPAPGIGYATYPVEYYDPYYGPYFYLSGFRYWGHYIDYRRARGREFDRNPSNYGHAPQGKTAGTPKGSAVKTGSTTRH